MSTLAAALVNIVGPVISNYHLEPRERKALEELIASSPYSNPDRDPVEAETFAAMLPHFQKALQQEPRPAEEETRQENATSVPEGSYPVAALLVAEGDKLITQAINLMDNKSAILDDALLENLADMYDELKAKEDAMESGHLTVSMEVATKYLGDAERLLRRCELMVNIAEGSPATTLEMLLSARTSA
ncbi:hypothetical protein C8R46DRAFT_1132123 [Mycena filopes]|nr:hypothetical protein C8R46DRAFT_1132123 [Mycena filopes]